MEGVNFGLRTSKLALTHYGDLTHVTPSELQIAASTDILR
jgi:2-dehydro-3-deoxygluconokinase